MKRFLASILILPLLVLPVRADTIKWVDFDVSYESMKYALEQDIATFDQEKHISWIDTLALAACRTGGKCGLAGVKKAVADLKKDLSPEELLGDLYKTPGSVVCDTHCIRICGRLGLSHGKEPEKVESQLRAILPPEESSDFCHRIVLFGRDCCTARNPDCGNCPLSLYCREYNPEA